MGFVDTKFWCADSLPRTKGDVVAHSKSVATSAGSHMGIYNNGQNSTHLTFRSKPRCPRGLCISRARAHTYGCGRLFQTGTTLSGEKIATKIFSQARAIREASALLCIPGRPKMVRLFLKILTHGIMSQELDQVWTTYLYDITEELTIT